jgi:hypothetical protein
MMSPLSSTTVKSGRRVPRTLTVLTALVALSGCTGRYVVPPDSDPTARMRFVTLNDSFGSGAFIQTFANEACKNPMQIGIVTSTPNFQTAKRLDMLDPPPEGNKRYLEERIPAGLPFIFSMFYSNPHLNCTVTSSFEPEAGKQYEAVFALQRGICFMSVRELVEETPDRVLRRPVTELWTHERVCRGS